MPLAYTNRIVFSSGRNPGGRTTMSRWILALAIVLTAAVPASGQLQGVSI
jgi:hypothetical protein